MSIQYVFKPLPSVRSNSFLCDTSGHLSIYTNGHYLYDKNLEAMEGGESFGLTEDENNGFSFVNSFIILPFPGDKNKFVHIYGKKQLMLSVPTVAYPGLYYAIGDITENNGLGRVISRDNLFSSDTIFAGQITAARHSNGRDWWIFAQHDWKPDMYLYLLDSDNITLKNTIIMEGTEADGSLAQTVFSPDGNWFARYRAHGSGIGDYHTTLDIFRFDRCYGILYDRQVQSLHDTIAFKGGVAFSENSRYMYASRWDTIYQYDMQAADIFSSQQVVAIYDGFLADFNQPTGFFHMRLAPDHKIYMATTSVTRYLHVINAPDSAGVTCNVQQHGIHLPVFNDWIIPNIPYYRLYADEGSACDTLTSAVGDIPTLATDFKLAPNPADEYIQVYSGQAEGAILPYITITDVSGRIIKRLTDWYSGERIYIADLPSGMYFLELEEVGGNRFVLRWVKG